MHLTKKIILLTLCLISAVSVIGQIPQFQYCKQIGASGIDIANAVTLDGSGNLYSTGHFYGIVDFDPGVGTFTLSSTSTDVFILKLDVAGNFVWAKRIGGNNVSIGNSIRVDASGNVYTVGYFAGTPDFDPGVGTYTMASIGIKDVFISKLDASGNFVWAKQFGGPFTNSCDGKSLALDASGNVYTTGYFNQTVDFDPGAGVFNLTANNYNDVFISKLDASGNFVWAKQIGAASSSEEGRGIALDATGNIFTTGFFGGTVDFDPGAAVFNLTSGSNGDVFISKLDASGNFVWAKQLTGISGSEGHAITIDINNNVYTTGLFFGTVDFDPGAGSSNLTSSGGNDVFVSKLNSNGNFIWARKMGGSAGDYANSIDTDINGNVYTTGGFQGTADYDPGTGTFNLTSMGYEDIFISQLNSSGTFLWAQQMGGIYYDAGNSLCVDASLGVYTSGYFQDIVDFDPASATYTLTSDANSYDVFIHKLNQCFTPVQPNNATLFANQLICSNNTTALSATGTGTINWFAGLTSTVVLGTGTTYLTPTLSAGTYTYYAEVKTCTTSIRTPITITVNALPAINASSSQSLICIGQTASLTSTGATTYTWNTASTNTTIIVSPTITTSYTVTGTDTNGCMNSFVLSQPVSVCTKNSSNSFFADDIFIYPNPLTDILNIEINSNERFIEKFRIEIYNAIGQLVTKETFSNRSLKVDTKGLIKGLYFIKVLYEYAVLSTKKIIK